MIHLKKVKCAWARSIEKSRVRRVDKRLKIDENLWLQAYEKWKDRFEYPRDFIEALLQESLSDDFVLS